MICEVSHEDTLCHWERGKKGRAETGISRRFSTALWVPFGIVFGVPASPSKKRMENEGLWRSSTVHLNSFGANVGHVCNIFAYRCFLFAIPMLRVCRAAPLKSRFRSQDIITALPVTSWEPPNPRKNDIWLFSPPVHLLCFSYFQITTQKVQFSQGIYSPGRSRRYLPGD